MDAATNPRENAMSATVYVNDYRNCHSSTRLEKARTGYLTRVGTVSAMRENAEVFPTVADATAAIERLGAEHAFGVYLGKLTAYIAF
jgi:hypothetical protein